VLANGYGLPGTTGYDTAVAFRVKNPSSQAGILRMPCRVTVSSGPDVIFASDGRDAVTLRPGESHVVVYETTAIKGTKPTAASVQFYPAPSMYVDGKGLSDTTKWDVANSRVTCDKSFIQCNVTADLTWKGDAPQRNVSISVVTHQAGDNSGPIVGAGNGQPDYSFQQITTGQTVPVQVSTFGYVQNGPTGGLTLPSGPLTLEIYVASEPVTP